jgi:hypothetical protein
MAIKISGKLRDITILSLEHVYGTRKPHDKSIRFDKDLFLLNSKPENSPTLKENRPQNIFIKNV